MAPVSSVKFCVIHRCRVCADRHVFEQPEPAPLRRSHWTPYQPKHVNIQSAGQPGAKSSGPDFGSQRQQVRPCGF